MTAWRQLYYDDATALKAKYDLVNRHGLRGVGIWALGYDGTRTELYAALKAKFITDADPTHRQHELADPGPHLAQRRRSVRDDHGQAHAPRPSSSGATGSSH